MKKCFLFFVLFFCLSLSSANALLPIGLYGGIKASENFNRHSSNSSSFLEANDSSMSAGVVAGVRLLDFRFELEYTYKMDTGIIRAGGHSKKFDVDLKMFNVYYNFFDFLMFNLYVNAGFGKYDVKSSLVKREDSKAWNVGVGTNMSFFDAFNVDVGIRHIELGKMKFFGRSNKLSFEEIYAGVRFGF